MSQQQDSEPSIQESTSNEPTHSMKDSETHSESEWSSWFSKGGLWSSAQSYLGRIAAAVQEETQGLTLDKVKKDLEEFSQQLYSEVQGMQDAIIKESQKQKEARRSVATESITVPVAPLNSEWKNWSHFLSQSSNGQVQTKSGSGRENSIHSDPQESVDVEHTSYWVPKPFCRLLDPFFSNYRIKALEVHANPSLFLDMNVAEHELQQFGKEMEEAIESLSLQVLHHSPAVKEVYEWNVPAKMDSTRFWSLYFYKLDSIAKEEMTKQSLLSSNIQNMSTQEEELLAKDWSSEEEEIPLPDSLDMEWEEQQDDNESVQEETRQSSLEK
ncbi:hypothetical protein GpartN1_g5788.t1 [Galdieria partita]|uniref:BSD domain-containing protein n=1 Tax=Galdieria partita TaxID=83374 RepID=A0A9C7Q1U8_9RHOD|nr:hypothetical protein GpartN1_g5788.t1 [Galdieria partita]